VLFIQIPIDSLWFFFLFFGIITNLDFANRWLYNTGFEISISG
jgi:hypothetical protein